MNIMLLSVSVWSGNVTDITPETRDFFHWLSALIAIPAVAYAGQPFFRSALDRAAQRARSTWMCRSRSGVMLAVGMSLVETINHAEHAYFDSAVMLLFFLLCGRYLDRAMRRAHPRGGRQSGRAARRDGAASWARAANSSKCRPRRCNPAIGSWCGPAIVCRPMVSSFAGTSEIDESLVTGETMRRDARVSATPPMRAASTHSGALTLRVTAAGERHAARRDRAAARSGGQNEVALRQAFRPRRAALRAGRAHGRGADADRLACWPAHRSHDALIAAIAVLIITCPCALALAVPAVQVVAAGRLFRSGVILNDGDAIERLAEVDTVVFDKTGTLTLPEARVTNAASVPADLLQLAARLALSSRAPAGGGGRPREARDQRPFRRRGRRARRGRARDSRRHGGAARESALLRCRRSRRIRRSPIRR